MASITDRSKVHASNPMNPPARPLGATLESEGVRYRVWAPVVNTVSVEIISDKDKLPRTIAMQSLGGGHYSAFDKGGRAGDLYQFRLNNGQTFPDPASRWQPEGVHGPSMVIDPTLYSWRDRYWRRPPFRDLVIYELHVGTFSPRGTFRSAIDHLPHIRECGANAMELMPIADFDGDRNWGYDGVCLFAPSRAYGHPDDLRALVDAAHGMGLTVILDVVYNHFGPAGNYLHSYIGDYLDEHTKTPWGGAIRYADPAFRPFRDWIISNPGYWMREFHIDGFRLDATHAIADDRPQHILQELTATIHSAGGFAIAEDSRNEVAMIVSPDKGGIGFDAVWADDFHHSVRVANTGEDEGYLGDFNGSLGETVDTLRCGWLYRGQPAKSEEGKPRGTDCLDAPPERFIFCTSNHDQTGNHAFGERIAHRIDAAAYRAAEVLLCLSPYTPMLFMGQEWAASSPFLFFTDHHPDLGKLIKQGRREEFRHFKAFRDPAYLDRLPDPQDIRTFQNSKLHWEEREMVEHAPMLELHRASLRLRAAEAAFRPADRGSWQVEALKMGVGALRLHSTTSDWLVLFDLKGEHRGSLQDEPVCQSPGAPWQFVLSSNEARFGGLGNSALDVSTMEAAFAQPETLVLRAASENTGD